MIIIGAKGFAKHSLQVLFENGGSVDDLCFFDDLSEEFPTFLYGQFRIVRSLTELSDYFIANSREFILGVGGSLIRETLSEKIIGIGGVLSSLISKRASIGNFGVKLNDGLSIMENSIIENDVSVGRGCLINMCAILSHDVIIGQFCEVSPGAKLLGRVVVGDYSEIGSNAVILPDIKVGSNVRVGAGAVVTKDVPDNSVVVGIPAREIKR
jgi:sugar O-acyltransferase (sialic acid O-acetyltransferase NeuD family)